MGRAVAFIVAPGQVQELPHAVALLGRGAWIGDGRSRPTPVQGQAGRTSLGRPGARTRLSTWTATPVARRPSVRERGSPPITCLHHPVMALARARSLHPAAFRQATLGGALAAAVALRGPAPGDTGLSLHQRHVQDLRLR